MEELSKEKCEFPKCDEDGLCCSGNFLGKIVCRFHFGITNGTETLEMSWEDICALINFVAEDLKKSK